MDKVVEHTFVLEGNGKVRDFPGNYSAYREVKAKEDLEAQYNKSAAVPVAATASKISYEQRKELNRIEREIAQLEQKRLTTTDKFNQANLSSDDFAKLHKELNDITKLIEEKEIRWLELNEEG
jgi:ATP-binding cassette subfamily F protein uup